VILPFSPLIEQPDTRNRRQVTTAATKHQNLFLVPCVVYRWFLNQTEDGQAVIRMKVELLSEYGTYLSRPYADTLKGSSLNNLKELRSKTKSRVFRVAFIFDEERKAILIPGGDKKNKNEKPFYRNLVKQAETIYLQSLDDKRKE
jgi:hypothetical protein